MSEENYLSIGDRVTIPLDEFDFAYARSGGPGGQNVNKVNSKVILRWAVTATPSLPESIRARFLTRYASRLTTEGELIITSQRFRDQRRNADDCITKLKEMVDSVIAPPIPRRAVKPSKAANQRRVESKRVQSAKKSQRKVSLD